MRLGSQPFLWKWVLYTWELKKISISKAEHLPSFWNRGPGELGKGLFILKLTVHKLQNSTLMWREKAVAEKLWRHRKLLDFSNIDSQVINMLVFFSNTVELLYNAHLGDRRNSRKWPLWGGRDERWPIFLGSTTCLSCQVHAYCIPYW